MASQCQWRCKLSCNGWGGIQSHFEPRCGISIAPERWQIVDDAELERELIAFEQQENPRQFKVGVLLVREGQDTEEQMFGNQVCLCLLLLLCLVRIFMFVISAAKFCLV